MATIEECAAALEKFAAKLGGMDESNKQLVRTVSLKVPDLDVTFHAPRFDAAGKRIAGARFERVLHNGILIHDDVEFHTPTGSNRPDPEGTPGPLLLQGHGNILQFRNIWLAEKK